MRHSNPDDGAEIIEFPQDPREDPPATGETTIPQSGSMLAALKAIAGDVGVKPRDPDWTTQTAIAVRQALTNARRAERNHRQQLRAIGYALAGKSAEDVPGYFEVDAERLAAEARRLREAVAVKSGLIDEASARMADMAREIEGLRRELARRGE